MFQNSFFSFTGTNVDLLESLAQSLNFSYELYPAADGKFGIKLPNSSWNGVIGDLLNQKANFSNADLGITKSRGEAVDFTADIAVAHDRFYMKKPMAEVNFMTFFEVFDLR